MFSLAREIAREAADQADRPRDAAAIKSRKTIAAIESLARSDQRLAALSDQWDADAWLLNTPNGILDLRTGKIGPHDPLAYLTKTTTVGPEGECPTWLRFLARVTDGDDDLVGILQRMCGYCLTGDISEHALFFLFGHGGNGKSVFIDTLSGILNDYAWTAAIETFTASNTDSHPAGLAALRGARFVTATETEEGRKWAESRIKALTGGDRVSARFMRQDFFVFTPSFKLVIAGNHKPGLRSVDEAIRRRFNLIPFTVSIPPEERDPHLAEKLKAEWPGILKWMVDGCLEWQRNGLGRPAVVTDATAAYLEGEDALMAWVDDRCIRDPSAWSSGHALFSSWSMWASQSGEAAGSKKSFSQTMEAHGFHARRSHQGRGFDGLKLRESYEFDGDGAAR
jgi:putative DNA primase/helicase